MATKEKSTEGIVEFELYKGAVKGKFYGPSTEKPNRHLYYINGKQKSGVTTFIGIKDKSRPLVIWATGLAEDELIACLESGKKIDDEAIYRACSLHEVRKQEAADLGTEVHDWAEAYINHKLKPKTNPMPDMPTRPGAQVAAMAFLDWEKEHKVKFVSSERVVYSKKHDFIGKMDIEAKIDGDLCLVDIKSSNGLYNSVNMQTAAYAKADEEESGREYKGRWALRVAKETEEEYMARMKKKQQKRIRLGKEPQEIAPYQVFEAKFLDSEEGSIDRDYKAFLAAKHLFEWDKSTDYFLNR